MITTNNKIDTFDYLDSLNMISQEYIDKAIEWAEDLDKYRDIKQTHEILKTVCDCFLINPARLEERNNYEPYRTARLIFYYLAEQEGHTRRAIGYTVNKGESTVTQGVNKIKGLIQPGTNGYDKRLHSIIKYITSQLHDY